MNVAGRQTGHTPPVKQATTGSICTITVSDGMVPTWITLRHFDS